MKKNILVISLATLILTGCAKSKNYQKSKKKRTSKS